MYVCTYVYGSMHVCVYVCLSVCISVCMYVCMYVYIYTYDIYMYTCIRFHGSDNTNLRQKESVLGQTGSVESLSGLPKAVDRDPRRHLNIRILPAIVYGIAPILGLGTRM